MAFIVCQHYGIDTSDYSFGYLASWSEGKEVPELKASLNTIRQAASDLITKIDDKVREKTTVKEMDEFMEAHGDELPFDNPEADQPIGYIKVTPPVDFNEFKPEKKITITAEKSDEVKEKSSEKDNAVAKKTAKKTSIKDKITAGKKKAAEQKKSKSKPDKDLQAAM